MLNRCYIKLSLVNILEMVFVFIEILFKILLFKGGVLIYAEHCIYMKSSFPKRDKRQIYAILLCTEPIHCSINVSCQIAIFPCLKCTSLS